MMRNTRSFAYLFFIVGLMYHHAVMGTEVSECSEGVCLNGGTCFQSGSDDSIFCQCPSGFSGKFCEIQEATSKGCESSPCQNGGQCFSSSSNQMVYVCSCTEGFKGTHCETPDAPSNICQIETCFNNGSCFASSTNSSQFMCICKDGFEGNRCEIMMDREPCLPNPCLNEGRCFQNSEDGIFCSCERGFTGQFCELDISCGDSLCSEGEICSEDSRGQKLCTCPEGYGGPSCNITDPCLSSPCSVGGSCMRSEDWQQFRCLCNIDGDMTICDPPCISNPCQNGGFCKNTDHSFQCTCTSDYFGQYCQEEYSGDICERVTCLNNGTCFASSSNVSQFLCLCSSGFQGQLCEVEDKLSICSPNPCLHGGICFQSYDMTSMFCSCHDEYTGRLCETELDACSSDPCLNEGTCVLSSIGSFTCECQPGFQGEVCEKSGACESSPCANNGSCFNAHEFMPGEATFKCVCAPGYYGLYCQEQLSSVLTCGDSICGEREVCVTNSAGQELCACMDGFGGPFCNVTDPCLSSPCSSGGTCVRSGDWGRFLCFCVVDQLYVICGNPCNSGPCKHGGRCENTEDSYICNCTPDYMGEHCELRAGPCDPSPCLNGAACYSGNTDYFCNCLDGFVGKQCQYNDLCHSSPCSNGGTCKLTSFQTFTCTCLEGFAGLLCEDPVIMTTVPGFDGFSTKSFIETPLNPASDVCTPNPCFNSAGCMPADPDGDGVYRPACLCPPGFTGLTCRVKLPVPAVCQDNPCGPQGRCYSNASATNGYSCMCDKDQDCLVNIMAPTVDPAGVLPCDSNPCMNRGVCSEWGEGFICQCPPYYVGDFCEMHVTDCTFNDDVFKENQVRKEGCVECNCSNSEWTCSDENCYCYEDGNVFSNGQTYSKSCITCFCYEGGWLCPDIDCTGTCSYLDQVYFNGEVRDGTCEVCQCIDGDWLCTDKQCEVCYLEDETYLEGSSRDEGCNTCFCTNKQWVCTVKNCDELPLTLKFRVDFDVPYNQVKDESEVFINSVTQHLEENYNIYQNQIHDISVGSSGLYTRLVIIFNESRGSDTPIRPAVDEIEQKVTSGDLTVHHSGQKVDVIQGSFNYIAIKDGSDEEETNEGANPLIILVIVLAALIASILLFVASYRVYFWQNERTTMMNQDENEHHNDEFEGIHAVHPDRLPNIPPRPLSLPARIRAPSD